MIGKSQVIRIVEAKGEARYGKEEIKHQHAYNRRYSPAKAARCDDRDDQNAENIYGHNVGSEKPIV